MFDIEKESIPLVADDFDVPLLVVTVVALPAILLVAVTDLPFGLAALLVEVLLILLALELLLTTPTTAAVVVLDEEMLVLLVIEMEVALLGGDSTLARFTTGPFCGEG